MSNFFDLVSTRKYYLIKIGIVVSSILTFGLLALVLTRGTRENIMQAHGYPFYLQLIVGFFGFIFLLTTLALLFMKDSKMRQLEFAEKLVGVKNFQFHFDKIKHMKISLNSHSNKPIHYREITSFGGNNWLEIEEQNGEKHRYEFLIRSEKQEKEILELVEKWRENGLSVEVGKSPKMFWEIFM